ncbi:MAG: Type 1 glutamine amidotransferase-like domain-containing protein [Acholeplasmataceae bacterium]|jgi:peptidase E|nr:Type 1 glutamine amidotransferase-like domain-containing protein [Acholeplasmataceae bacterium]
MTNILLSRGILHHPHIFEHAKTYIKSTDKVVIIALSFFEEYLHSENDYHTYYGVGGEYYQKMIDSFAPYGIKESQIEWVNFFKDNTVSASIKIKNADIIYFPGGSPDQMMKRIISFGIKELIESHQKLYIGSSAGAMIQMHEYHMSPDPDYPHFSYEQGLNLCKGFSIEVHYRRRKKQKSSLRKVFRAFRHPIYVIPDDGALIVTDQHILCIESAYQMYNKKGIIRRTR